MDTVKEVKNKMWGMHYNYKNADEICNACFGKTYGQLDVVEKCDFVEAEGLYRQELREYCHETIWEQ